MAISRTAMIQGVWGVLMGVTMGCAASQPRPVEQSAAASESVPEEVGAAPQCVDDKDHPVTCLSDSDCCKGFVCGRDPELSPRQSYCIYGG
jgi:Ion channel inhibitory toxin